MIIEEDSLAHYGTPRHSGRYPWGSGGNESTRNQNFLGYIADLKRQGLSNAEIAEGIGIATGDPKFSSTKLIQLKSIAINELKQAKISQAERLAATGMSNGAIAKEMGLPNESSVRSLLAPGTKDRNDILQTTAKLLRDQVAEKGLIDVSVGVERHLGISDTKLKTAVTLLEQEGYKLHYVKVPQMGTKWETSTKVLSAPGVTYSEVLKNRDSIKQIFDYSEDGGRSYAGKIVPPTSISSTRVAVKYGKDGGAKADGVIYVRPGVEDTNLGASNYAQVRIVVDGTHYLKGMAMYKDGLPPGVDLEFNTVKSDTGNKKDAMKPVEIDPDNPYGAVIDRQHGVMNIIREEGKWETWSHELSSQMLTKQDPSLAKSQLNMTYERSKNDLDEIMTLTNRSVRKKLLEAYAETADSSAVHLQAAALPGTLSHVILPITSLKESEIYAPNYDNGEIVVLIRHPHAGPFEIPELRVNNNNRAAKLALGNSQDAVGIHPNVAKHLSGADFDGDSVLVIRNNNGKVKTAPILAGLKNFDPQAAYPAYDGMLTMDGGRYNAATKKVDYGGKSPATKTKQVQMGMISNLITDMTIRGATSVELAAAVRHSMVVIDAEKHALNYKLSAQVNGITNLKTKYQGGPRAGASTLISRARSKVYPPERKQGFRVDKVTGEKIFTETGASYIDKKGKLIFKTTQSKALAETPDAFTLSSGTLMESIYAEHANKLKALANYARKEAVNIKTVPASKSAKAAYSKELASLDAKLNVALKNAPLERQAQILANAQVRLKVQANPNMDEKLLKKTKYQALLDSRIRTNAKKNEIVLEGKEWEAIQSGGISDSKLKRILDNTDLEQIRKLATPKPTILMTDAKLRRAESMLRSGYTQAEVAEQLGVSLTTLKTGIK